MKPQHVRKRARDSDDEEEGATGRQVAATSALRAPKVVNVFGTGAGGPVAVSSARDLAYAASGSGMAAAVGGDAFATNEADKAYSQDGRAQLEKKLALAAVAAADLEAGRKVYRGQAGYSTFIAKDGVEAVARAKVSGALGPARAPTNVRGIVRIDYAPDVCKDFKETGQCPFGDSCIFLHDRSDFKSGWQIELEWQALQKKKAARLAARLAAGGTMEGEESEEEEKIDLYKKALPNTAWADLGRAQEAARGGGGGSARPAKSAKGDATLPHACFLCRGPFKEPVQTTCGHYFCSSCAVARYKTTPFCAVCEKQTHGIFHAAPKLAGSAAAAGKGENEAADEEEEAAAGGGWS
jgi:RING finger protein 113A